MEIVPQNRGYKMGFVMMALLQMPILIVRNLIGMLVIVKQKKRKKLWKDVLMDI